MPPETSWAKGRMSSCSHKNTLLHRFYSVPLTFPHPPSSPSRHPTPLPNLLIFTSGGTQTQSSLCYPLKIQPSVGSHLLARPAESQITHILFKRTVNDEAERSQRSKMTVTNWSKREQTQAADSLVVKMTCHCVDFFFFLKLSPFFSLASVFSCGYLGLPRPLYRQHESGRSIHQLLGNTIFYVTGFGHFPSLLLIAFPPPPTPTLSLRLFLWVLTVIKSPVRIDWWVDEIAGVKNISDANTNTFRASGSQRATVKMTVLHTSWKRSRRRKHTTRSEDSNSAIKEQRVGAGGGGGGEGGGGRQRRLTLVTSLYIHHLH